MAIHFDGNDNGNKLDSIGYQNNKLNLPIRNANANTLKIGEALTSFGSINFPDSMGKGLPKDFIPIENLGKKPSDDFIPKDSPLGEKIGRVTMEYIEGIDGKYIPVYGPADALGNKEIIGYRKPNPHDVFK